MAGKGVKAPYSTIANSNSNDGLGSKDPCVTQQSHILHQSIKK